MKNHSTHDLSKTILLGLSSGTVQPMSRSRLLSSLMMTEVSEMWPWVTLPFCGANSVHIPYTSRARWHGTHIPPLHIHRAATSKALVPADPLSVSSAQSLTCDRVKRND